MPNRDSEPLHSVSQEFLFIPNNTETSNIHRCINNSPLLDTKSYVVKEKFTDQNNQYQENVSDLYDLQDLEFPTVQLIQKHHGKYPTESEMMKDAQEAFDNCIFSDTRTDVNDNNVTEDTYVTKIPELKQENKYIIDNEEITKYLPQKIDLSIEEIEKENIEFFEKYTGENINLDENKKQILESLDRKFFAKALDPRICEFVKKQIDKFSEKIISANTQYGNCIPVLAPNCLRIKSGDSLDIKIQKLRCFNKIPVKYIIASKKILKNTYFTYKDSQRSRIDSSKYLFACPYKIDNVDELSIFVFLTDDIFDENMQVNIEYLNLPLHFMFFSNMYEYEKFMFGCYAFDVDYVDNNNQTLRHLNRAKLSKTDSTQQLDKEKCTIKTFNAFKEVVNQKLLKIKNLHLQDRSRYLYTYLQNTKAQKMKKKRSLKQSDDTEMQLTIKKQKIDDTKIQSVTQKGKYLTSDNIKDLIRKKIINKHAFPAVEKGTKYCLDGQKVKFYDRIMYVNKKIRIKFQEEKNKTYNLIDLYDSGGFSKSIFSNFIEISKTRKIRSDIIKDLNKIGCNPNNSLKRIHNNAFILIHSKYIGSQKFHEIKKNTMKYYKNNNRIKRYNAVSILKTNQAKIQPKDNKIVIGLITEIPEINQDQEEQIFVFLPEGFDHEGDPLSDPNSVAIYYYFYDNVEDYTKNLGYPLYLFNLNYDMNCKNIDNSKYYYLLNAPDIDEIQLMSYMKQTYEIFDYRVLLRLCNI